MTGGGYDSLVGMGNWSDQINAKLKTPKDKSKPPKKIKNIKKRKSRDWGKKRAVTPKKNQKKPEGVGVLKVRKKNDGLF